MNEVLKKCTTCFEVKELSFFGKSKKSKDGHITKCKECVKEYLKVYNLNNKDVLSYKKCLYDKKYREDNKDKGKEYYLNNKESISHKSKEWYDNNKEHRLEVSKEWYDNNKEQKKLTQQKWVNVNRNVINEYRRSWSKNRRDTDSLFKIKENIKSSIRKSISEKKYRKKSPTTEILGCSFEEFKLYLESKFEIWMNWDNYGLYNGELNYGWDIDHIIPISSATTELFIYELNNFSNLQPLCSKINRDIKRDNII